MRKKWIGAAVLPLLLVFALALPVAAEYVGGAAWPVPAEKAASQYFADVNGAWSWAAGSVDLLYEKGMVSGVAGGFAPEKAITRGDLMLLILRALEIDMEADYSGQPTFQDVPVYSVYAPAAEAAWELGIVTGDGKNFYPRDPITREDAFTLIHRAARAVGAESLDAGGNLSMFRDGTALSAYARAAAANLVREGIIRGDGGLLRPKDGITRAEAAVLICRLMSTELSGGEQVADSLLAAAGLDRTQMEVLTLHLEKEAASADLGGQGQPDLRPYYVERDGQGRLKIYASLYFSGQYWCTVQAGAVEEENGFAVTEMFYSFG